jgi:hypothetical protein
MSNRRSIRVENQKNVATVALFRPACPAATSQQKKHCEAESSFRIVTEDEYSPEQQKRTMSPISHAVILLKTRKGRRGRWPRPHPASFEYQAGFIFGSRPILTIVSRGSTSIRSNQRVAPLSTVFIHRPSFFGSHVTTCDNRFSIALPRMSTCEELSKHQNIVQYPV